MSEKTVCKFWMVLCEGRGYPLKKHTSKQEAIAEAYRISEKEGQRAYVLEHVGFCEYAKPPIAWYPVTDYEIGTVTTVQQKVQKDGFIEL